MNYSFDFASVTSNLGPLFKGLVVTLELTVSSKC